MIGVDALAFEKEQFLKRNVHFDFDDWKAGFLLH